MARPSVPDTSALIREFHHPQFWFAFERSLSGGSTWLSSVVIAELYAGTRSRRESFLIGRLVAFMERAERLLVPTADEWILVGRLLNRRTRLHGAVRPREVVTATLSGDHRASDGHRGGIFLDALDRLLQEPENL